MPADPDVVVIPAGDALQGDSPRTLHVNVFAIARRPVTRAEYAPEGVLDLVGNVREWTNTWSDGRVTGR